MKYLFLLNRKFPFKSGETFLENEIEEISDYFDKIFIYPSDVTKKDKITRNIISKNVFVRIIEKESLPLRKLKYVFNSILFLNNKKKLSLREKIIEGYFLSASISQFKKIIKDIESLNIKSNDEIYIYSYWFYINSKVASLLKDYFQKNNNKVRFITRAHRFDIYEEKRKGKYIPQRIEILRELDELYACSDDGANYLKNKYPSFIKKIKTSYLGTYDHGIGKHSDRRKLNIVSCSRISKVKRVDKILDTILSLKESGINVAWTHIGGGNDLGLLKKRALQSNYGDICFLGAMSNIDVYNYYSKNDVDLFINVSSSEGLPVSIMEAISFGIPVIATDVGGTSEIVINEISGYLLDEDFEIKQLEELIIKIQNMSYDEYNNLTSNCRKLWEEKYQAKKNYKLFAEELIGGNCNEKK